MAKGHDRLSSAVTEAHMRTTIAKEKILQALQPLPDNTTVEDAIERLCFLAKIEDGVRQSNQGETITHEEATRRLTA